MGSITFAEIMEFYPEHNNSVFEDLKKDYQQGSLIPFVGAGLSVFCGYLQWPKVLERLAGFLYDKDAKAKDIKVKVQKMIADGELLQAAQTIYDHYPRMLKQLQKIIDYDNIKKCDAGKLYASATYVLPYLFRENLVMTTNFDRVLEEVYDRCHAKFGKVVSPCEPDILAQIRQSNPHCLFKLHGDIGPEIHDIEKLVFTQKQYDEAYDANGSLMLELSQWFQHKRLLFLGCSLMLDRTMEVLQQVAAQNTGVEHYAILACRPEDIGERCKELGKLGISAIYYPEDRHEAVRVLLERLLEETDHNAYEKLNQYAKKHIPATKMESRFMYDSEYFDFIGRESELEELQGFCQDSRLISWWAVTGAGGMGKSRLIYEFVKEQKKDGWEIVWLNRDFYTKLLDWTPPVDRCILVADDVQSYFQTVGEWFVSVSSRPRSEKLRIILLEREGKNLNSSKWAEMMQLDFPYDDTIQSLCYRSDFLQLEPLSENELKAIMMNFSVAYGKPLASGEQADRLLKTLRKVDSTLRRPIYALAIVDAWCDGKDPTRWDKEKILDELTNRELKFYYERLRNLSSDKISKELRSEFENLLARSCLMQVLPLDYITDKEYPKLHNRADKLDMDFFELLRTMGIIHEANIYIFMVNEDGTEKEQEGLIEVVTLDCPDLVKEYLVLRQAFDKGKMELLFPEDWVNAPQQLRFLSRVILDYPEKLEGKSNFWKEIFEGNPKSDFSAWIYSNLLLAVTVQFPELGEKTVKRLEELSGQFRENARIAAVYAKGLYDLSVEQPLKEGRQSIDKLKALYEEYEGNEEVAIAYAVGLYELTEKQPLVEREQSVSKLKVLYKQYGSNKEALFTYANGLVNLTAEQPLEEREQSVARLAVLHERYKDNEDVALAYASGLCNLVLIQPLKEGGQSMDKLRTLHEQYDSNEKLAVVYASGLCNLMIEQSLKEGGQSMDELRSLHEQYDSNEKITIAYGNGLYNLSFKQPLNECEQSVAKLKVLHEQYDSNEHITIAYVKALHNLSLKQPLKEGEQSIAKLRTLHKQYDRNKEIETLYANALELWEFRLKHADENEEIQFMLDHYYDEPSNYAGNYHPVRLKL